MNNDDNAHILSNDQLEKISQREYAKRLGVSNEAVRQAIAAGKIDKGFNDGKIIFEIANEEWGHLKMAPILFETSGESTKTPKSLNLQDDSSFAEAKRVREIMQARLATLDVKEREQELVRKAEVHQVLFSFAQQVRLKLMAVPDRIIDSVLSADNKDKARAILAAAQQEALENLSNINFDFQPRE